MPASVELKGRILVVEDDPAMRAMIRDYLRAHGADVDEASTVREVRAALVGYSGYDAVVADIHLPDGDATDAIDAHHAAIPLVFITGDSDRTLAASVIASDPAALLFKPFDFSELHAVVAHALRHNGRIARAVPRGHDRDTPIRIIVRPDADHDRRMPKRIAVRAAIAVALTVVAAFLLGQALVSDAPHPADTRTTPPSADQRVIVVPVAMPVQSAAEPPN